MTFCLRSHPVEQTSNRSAPIASSTSSNVLFSCPSQKPVSKSGNRPVSDTSAPGIDDAEDQPADQLVSSMTSIRHSHVEPTPDTSVTDQVMSRPEKVEMPARLEGEQLAMCILNWLTRRAGPTSLSFLLQTTLPAVTSESFDLRGHIHWEVSEDGDGLIRVKAPPTGSQLDPNWDSTKAKPILSGHLITQLVNAYFEFINPLFPIISRSEFAAKVNPSPLLLYSICGLGSTRRQFPRDVFAAVRGVINGLLRSNDILSDARFENVQALVSSAHLCKLMVSCCYLKSAIYTHNQPLRPLAPLWYGWGPPLGW